MKRVGLILSSAVAFCLTLAAPALAGSELPRPSGGGGTAVSGAGGGTAFTGANISLGLILLAALVVAGIAALAVSRRRVTSSR